MLRRNRSKFAGTDLGTTSERSAGSVAPGVRLCVPEWVPVIATASEAPRGNRPLLGAWHGLNDLKDGEPRRLRQLRITHYFYIDALPNIVQMGTLHGE